MTLTSVENFDDNKNITKFNIATSNECEAEPDIALDSAQTKPPWLRSFVFAS